MIPFCVRISTLLSAVLLAWFLAVPNAQAFEQHVVGQKPFHASDGALRIDIAGRQRMLSQRMAKSLCALSYLDDVTHAEAAQNAIRLFDWSLRVLRYGNGQGVVQAETNPRVQAAAEAVMVKWAHLGPNLWSLSLHRDDPLLATDLIEENMTLLAVSQALVSEIETAYQRSGVSPEGLRTVNRSGLMRMLSEKSIKETCFILQDYRPDEMRVNLSATLDLMGALLADLETGNSSDLIARPPSEEIRAELAQMRHIWDVVRPQLASVADGGVMNAAAFREIHDAAARFVFAANAATNLYADHFTQTARELGP